MSESEPTTDRARRQRAVETGAATDAVDRVSGRSNPGGQPGQATSRSRQEATARSVAAELGIDRGGIGSRDRIGGGTDVFLRSGGAAEFADVVQSDFASAADFVEPGDVTAQVNRQAITADPMVARDRRDDVASRARQQTAADTEFIEPADLEADVGAMGVTGLGIAADRRDDVGARARTARAADAPFIEPADLAADVTASGVQSVTIAPDRRDAVGDRAEADAAEGVQFVRASDLEADVTDTGISGVSIPEDRRDDVADRTRTTLAARSPFTEPGDFAVSVSDRGVDEAMLTPAGERRAAARQFESSTALGDVDPDTDLTDTGDGFGLTTDAQRELGALRLDEQVPEVTITPDDVTLEDGQAVFEREVPR